MRHIPTKLAGCIILEPEVYNDDRGYFLEAYNKKAFDNIMGAQIDFVQDNQSFSTKGVIRALHYQIGKFAQAKLVRVLHGEVLDVAVDLRRNSKTFGQHISVRISAKNKRQLFIPKGFAHGFVTLSDTAEFFYKCDNYYDKASERGIAFDDKDLNIDWILPNDQLILSKKDMELPSLAEAEI